MNQPAIQQLGRLLILLSQAWNGRSRELDQQLVALRNLLMAANPNPAVLQQSVRKLERQLAALSANQQGPLDKLLSTSKLSLRQLTQIEEVPQRFQDDLTDLTRQLGEMSDLQAYQPWLEAMLDWHQHALKALASSRRVAGQTNEQLLIVVRQQVAELLDQLIAQKMFVPQAEQLRSKLAQTATNQIQALLSQSVALAIRSLDQERNAFEGYLRDLDGAIGRVQKALSQSLAHSKEDAKVSQALKAGFAQEISSLREESARATDLNDLQLQVAQRLQILDSLLNQKVLELQNANQRQQRQLSRLELELNRAESQGLQFRMQLQQLSEESRTDTLTGVPNRAAYEERLLLELEGARQVGDNLVLAVVDIDLFKRINDGYGHQAGDKILRAVAQSLRQELMVGVDGSDFIARFGGEEFVILLPACSAKQAASRLDQLRSKVAAMPFRFRAQVLSVTVSIGFAQLTADDTAESLFGRADKALYLAKEEGRNRICQADDTQLPERKDI